MAMKVSKLIELLQKLPQDAPVLTAGSDHEYCEVACPSEATAAYSRDGGWREYYGDDPDCDDELEEDEELFTVVVI